MAVSTLLGFIFEIFIINLFAAWGNLPASGKFWTIFGCAYIPLTVITGWVYASRQSKIVGWFHALFMLGGAGIAVYHGFVIFNDPNIHNGPGNPVAGLDYGFALLLCVIAVVVGGCGTGVIVRISKKQL